MHAAANTHDLISSTALGRGSKIMLARREVNGGHACLKLGSCNNIKQEDAVLMLMIMVWVSFEYECQLHTEALLLPLQHCR